MQIVPFTELHTTDLSIDKVYRGGRAGNAGDDPLTRLLKVSAGGGFRYRGTVDALEILVLTSTLKEPDWPDTLDRETGIYTYYGDNKSPGRSLHETPRKGNELLRRVFDLAHAGVEGRRRVPPIFLFEGTGEWRDVVFLGLAVPGTADLRTSEDLVAIWKVSEGKRFQNYRARLTVLDTGIVKRAWIKDVIDGNPRSSNAPTSWLEWTATGRIQALLATRSLEYRTKFEQLPQVQEEKAMLESVYRYFRPAPHAFERCAASLIRLLLPDIASMDLTRPSRDGGRDAIGQFRIGTGASAILVDFALEAKCYDLNNGLGVHHMSRLISRLRHRQFGVLVTTSYVNVPAYREIKEDQHPIIVVAGVDIVKLLRNYGLANPTMVQTWLEQHFPLNA